MGASLLALAKSIYYKLIVWSVIFTYKKLKPFIDNLKCTIYYIRTTLSTYLSCIFLRNNLEDRCIWSLDLRTLFDRLHCWDKGFLDRNP